MTATKRKHIFIIILIIILIACISASLISNLYKNDYFQPKEDDKLNSEAEKQELYKNIIFDFESQNLEYYDNNIDGKGVYAWKEANYQVEQFLIAYSTIEDNYVPIDGTYKALHTEVDRNEKHIRALEDMNYRVFKCLNNIQATYKMLDINNLSLKKISDNIYSVSTKMIVNHDKNITDEINFKFIFFNDKIIDIIFEEKDETETSIFSNIYSTKFLMEANTNGRFIRKSNTNDIFSDILIEITFDDNNIVTYKKLNDTYTANLPDGYLAGTYSIENNKIVLTFTSKIISDTEMIVLNEPIVITLSNGMYYLYQSSYNGDV